VRRSLVVVVLCALALSSVAIAGNGGFAPPDSSSPNAERINDSYYWVAIFTGAILVLVEGALLWFVFRYRRGKRSRTEEGAQIHGNTNIELAWTIAPVLILVAIGSFIFYKLPGIQDVPSASAQGSRLDVDVKGYRFYWNYRYPNGVIAVDTLRAPAGRPVRLAISAPDFEVIHSWWIPALGGKFDAIPGVTNVTWFNANQPGKYRGQCAEFCGLQHARMDATVEAMPEAEFDAWLAAEDRAQAAGTSRLGAETFTGACAKCHGLSGEGDVGPRLQGNALLNDAAAVERVIREGRGEMPPVGKDWEDRQLNALTAYLKQEVLRGG
jgi:cytochrome c oxidase subunit 2